MLEEKPTKQSTDNVSRETLFTNTRLDPNPKGTYLRSNYSKVRKMLKNQNKIICL